MQHEPLLLGAHSLPFWRCGCWRCRPFCCKPFCCWGGCCCPAFACCRAKYAGASSGSQLASTTVASRAYCFVVRTCAGAGGGAGRLAGWARLTQIPSWTPVPPTLLSSACCDLPRSSNLTNPTTHDSQNRASAYQPKQPPRPAHQLVEHDALRLLASQDGGGVYRHGLPSGYHLVAACGGKGGVRSGVGGRRAA